MEGLLMSNDTLNQRQRLEASSNYKSYIESLITNGEFEIENEHDNESSKSHYKYPQFVSQPNVMLWDLEAQVNKENFILPNCPECGGSLKTLSLINNYRLRQLYCVGGIVLLLSTVLLCGHSKKHQFAGYDPRILTELSSFIKIPFRLFHRAGVSLKLSDYIFQNLSKGFSVTQIYESCQVKYKETLDSKVNKVGDNALKEVLASQKLCIPSPTIITQDFLTAFEVLKSTINETRHTMGVPGGFVYIDDSFEMKLSTLASNSKSPNKIVFVLNDGGHVMFWKLVNDTDCLKEVTSFIKSYNDANTASTIHGCYTTRCCEWRSEMVGNFGHEFKVMCNLNLLMEVMLSHLDELDGERIDELLLLDEIKQIFISSSTKDGGDPISLGFLEKYNKTVAQNEEIPNDLEMIKTHVSTGCFGELLNESESISVERRFLEIHVLLQKWTSNVHIGVNMVNALVSIGFHDYSLRNGVILPVTVPNRESSANGNCDVLSWGNLPLDSLMASVCSTLYGASSEVEGFIMFTKCLKNVSYCAPDLIKSSHLLPHFVSTLHVISISNRKIVAKDSEYCKDVEKIKFVFNRTNLGLGNSSSAFLSCFIRHLNTLSEPTEYLDHLCSIKIQYTMDFDSVEKAIDKLHEMVGLHIDGRALNSLTSIECLSNIFGVVFLFVTNIKRYPLVPVYPDDWNIFSPFILVLIEDGHGMVMLDPATLGYQDDQETNLANSVGKKKFNCRCGRGQAENDLPPKCVNNTDGARKYSSRCLCFRAGEPCSNVCDCRACANPFGVQLTRKRSRMLNQAKTCRQRNAHEAQKSLQRIYQQFHFVKKTYSKRKNHWNFVEHTLFEFSLWKLLENESFANEVEKELDSSLLDLSDKLLFHQYEHFRRVLCISCPDLKSTLKERSELDFMQRCIDRQESLHTYF